MTDDQFIDAEAKFKVELEGFKEICDEHGMDFVSRMGDMVFELANEDIDTL